MDQYEIGQSAFDSDATILEQIGLLPTVALLAFDDHYEIRADLPECDNENVGIEFQDGLLTITGETILPVTGDLDESPVRSFHYSIGLPDDADRADVSPSFTEGRLNIRIGRPTVGPESEQDDDA